MDMMFHENSNEIMNDYVKQCKLVKVTYFNVSLLEFVLKQKLKLCVGMTESIDYNTL